MYPRAPCSYSVSRKVHCPTLSQAGNTICYGEACRLDRAIEYWNLRLYRTHCNEGQESHTGRYRGLLCRVTKPVFLHKHHIQLYSFVGGYCYYHIFE